MKKCLARLLVLSLTCLIFSASAATFYVNVNSTNPVPPYADWTTAATNIQDAIDASSNGDSVLVTNGVYDSGGRVVYGSLTNRVVINKTITVQSVNGPSVTMIEGNSIAGSNAVRCLFMGNNAVLAGFTVTNGGTLNSGDFFQDESGGGIWTTNNSGVVVSNCLLTGNIAVGMGGGAYNASICNSSIVDNNAYDGGAVGYDGAFVNFPIVTNCVLVNNSASAYGGAAFGARLKNCMVIQNVAAYGGGEASSDVYGCLIASNAASQSGGGVEDAVDIVNCTIVDNTAYQGAGGIEYPSTVNNSIIYDNTVITSGSPNCSPGSTLLNCCTIPAANGSDDITNDPGFVDYSNGDFNLASNSPCINGGGNLAAYTTLTTDLDGNPRIAGGLVDIGAYEFQTPGFILPYYWAQEYGLSANDGALIDPYADGMNYWWVAVTGSNPTNAASFLKVSASDNASGVALTWPGMGSIVYCLQRSTNLLANSPFVSIYTNPINPIATTLRFTDRSVTNGSSYFYRVGVLY